MIQEKQSETRMEKIRKKGFDMTHNIYEDIPLSEKDYGTPLTDYARKEKDKRIKVGLKQLSNALLSLGDLDNIDNSYLRKEDVLRAIANQDSKELRAISNYFYKVSGIYNRLCRYMAYMYKYDWMVVPTAKIDQPDAKKEQKTFYDILQFLDNFGVKKFCGETALKIIKNGCYYGYLIEKNNQLSIQELPPNYCRSRFKTADGRDAVEFNVKFFDDSFRDVNQKMKMLNLFPDDIKRGYLLYKQGKLPQDFSGDSKGWYLLDTEKAIKFDICGEDFPFFMAAIPAIIDLDEAKGLERKKMKQQLLKIVVQTLPLDKNGDLIFDSDEARVLHNNIVSMLKDVIGVDVLTSFGNIDIEDVAQQKTNAVSDDLEKMERAVFNEAGVPQNQFNAEGNVAQEKSILNDEASMFNLVQQFEDFLNYIIKPFNKKSGKVSFKVQILPTTIYNYQNLSKLYKEQTQIGYSKFLPQLALGQSQSSILASAYFENKVLKLNDVFIPPMMSSTMSSNTQKTVDQKSNDPIEKKKAGRPSKEEQGESVSDKTIQNQESLS